MIWLGIIIGILIMQVLTLIVALTTDENEDVLIPFSVFLLYPLILLINKIGRGIREKKKKKKLKQKEINNETNKK